MKTRIANPIPLALVALLALFSKPAVAHQDEIETLKQTVRELQRKLEELDQQFDQKVKKVERNQELASEDAAKRLRDAPIVNASSKGFSFRSADKEFEVKLRGLAQLDHRTYDGDAFDQVAGNVPSATDGFVARRLRPTIEGTVFGRYTFRFTPEFGESGDGSGAGTGDRRNNRTRLIDAYFDINASDALKFRIGKHKPFVSLERLQSSNYIKFIERGYISNNMLPSRDNGISVFGDVFGKRLSYAVGYFNGIQDGGEGFTSVDNNNDKDFAWRLFATPFAGSGSWLDGLGVGMAGTWATDSDTNALPRYRTAGLNKFFSFAGGDTDPTKARGDRIRLSPQGYFYKGPLGILAEYAQVRQGVQRASVGSAELHNSAWQVAATWLLTGEESSFNGVKPARPFKFGEASGWGAWEVGLRYQENNLDDDAGRFAEAEAGYALSARTLGVGLTWYHNENSKFLVNYEFTRLGDVESGTGSKAVLTGDRERFLAFRYQVAY